jgi:hypothetical protein
VTEPSEQAKAAYPELIEGGLHKLLTSERRIAFDYGFDAGRRSMRVDREALENVIASAPNDVRMWASDIESIVGALFESELVTERVEQ